MEVEKWNNKCTFKTTFQLLLNIQIVEEIKRQTIKENSILFDSH